MASWLKRRLAHERGSVLAITAVMMVPMLGFAAFAIDMGNWYQARKAAQAAADAGALAGEQDLPNNPSQAGTDATTWATKNLAGRISGATVTYATPYNSNSSEIQVTVTASNVPSIFGKILGITSKTITATAVAKNAGGTVPGAIFAKNTTCGNGSNGIFMNGSGITINGGTHSNGSLYVNGSSINTGTTSYGGPNNCTPDSVNGSGNTVNATVDSNTEPWPADYSQHPLPSTCTYNVSGGPTWNYTNQSIPGGTSSSPAVYCVTGNLTINGSGITMNNVIIEATGTVTLNGSGYSGSGDAIEAASITVNGSGIALGGYNVSGTTGNLLYYMTGSGTLTINGSAINGNTVFAPNATISINGSGGTVSGFVEGNNVSINGSGYTFTGTGPSVTSSATGYLVQ